MDSLIEKQIKVEELTNEQIKEIINEYRNDILFTEKAEKYIDKVIFEHKKRKTT
jgi:hypothetical protein